MLAMIAEGYGGALDYGGRMSRRALAVFAGSLAAVGGLLYLVIGALYRLPDEVGLTIFYPALTDTGPAIRSGFVYAATDSSGDPAGSYGPAVFVSLFAAFWLLAAVPTLHAAIGRRVVDAGRSAAWAFLPFAPVAAGVVLAIGRSITGVIAERILDLLEGTGPLAEPLRSLAGSFEIAPSLASFAPAIGIATALALVPLALLVLAPSRDGR